ncbi:hypothetical protein SAMN04487969_105255 [Paenibacillus algorifonticola]|uniref:Uncharacterized protein n=1 Tax=Paenibacillus algorifonticola TaxID=684063 RepID=A0A1I2CTA6_9BACL|nr:hypothetical protein SAMN04487969_105255 [Paenibacillus algorifonticola]
MSELIRNPEVKSVIFKAALLQLTLYSVYSWVSLKSIGRCLGEI